LLGRFKSTIPHLQIYLLKKANSEKLGLGIDNPCRIYSLSLRMNKCLERVNGRHFWNYQLRNDTKMSPQLKSYFFIVPSIVYDHSNQRRRLIVKDKLYRNRSTGTLGFPDIFETICFWRAIFETICFWQAILRNHKDPQLAFEKKTSNVW
jgi:hypothetical protein